LKKNTHCTNQGSAGEEKKPQNTSRRPQKSWMGGENNVPYKIGVSREESGKNYHERKAGRGRLRRFSFGPKNHNREGEKKGKWKKKKTPKSQRKATKQDEIKRGVPPE